MSTDLKKYVKEILNEYPIDLVFVLTNQYRWNMAGILRKATDKELKGVPNYSPRPFAISFDFAHVF